MLFACCEQANSVLQVQCKEGLLALLPVPLALKEFLTTSGAACAYTSMLLTLASQSQTRQHISSLLGVSCSAKRFVSDRVAIAVQGYRMWQMRQQAALSQTHGTMLEAQSRQRSCSAGRLALQRRCCMRG